MSHYLGKLLISPSSCMHQGAVLQLIRHIWNTSPAVPPPKSLLQESQDYLQGAEDEDQDSAASTRKLLRLSLGLQRARAPGITDQLLQTVMKNYKARRTSAAKQQFLSVICQDFGIQCKQITMFMDASIT